MPLVTATLIDLIRRQIAAHGTVVWYDPAPIFYSDPLVAALKALGMS